MPSPKSAFLIRFCSGVSARQIVGRSAMDIATSSNAPGRNRRRTIGESGDSLPCDGNSEILRLQSFGRTGTRPSDLLLSLSQFEDELIDLPLGFQWLTTLRELLDFLDLFHDFFRRRATEGPFLDRRAQLFEF